MRSLVLALVVVAAAVGPAAAHQASITHAEATVDGAEVAYTIRVAGGDLAEAAGRPADASTLAEGTERLMDAITDLEAALRGETPPATRMLFRRHPDGPGPVAPDHPAS